jgi:hypothetical protein
LILGNFNKNVFHNITKHLEMVTFIPTHGINVHHKRSTWYLKLLCKFWNENISSKWANLITKLIANGGSKQLSRLEQSVKITKDIIIQPCLNN